MPSIRVQLHCKNPTIKKVKGILYSRRARRASPVFVPTAIHPVKDSIDVPRFPSFESMLGLDARLHESWVVCQDDDGKEHRFMIAAQYSPHFEVNCALKEIAPEVTWKGGVLVMRGGTFLSVVNIDRAEHKVLARKAVRKFLLETAPIVAHATANNVPLVIPTEL